MDGFPSKQSLALYRDLLDELGAVINRASDKAALMRYIKEKKIDLIHAHSSLTYPLAKTLAGRMRIPYVITCHGLGSNKPENRPYLRDARAVICISPRVAGTVRSYAKNVSIIPNGVDLQEFRPDVKSGPVKIAFVARIDHRKQRGYEQFCKAVDLLDNVEFYIASNKTSPSKTARHLGWTNEVASLLAKTDIVAGTGRAIMEGLAAGNAAVVIGQTYQGILTPEKAANKQFLDVSGLAGRNVCYRTIFYDLAGLVKNRPYLRQLQKFGRKLAAEKFNIKIHATRVIQIYKEVTG